MLEHCSEQNNKKVRWSFQITAILKNYWAWITPFHIFLIILLKIFPEIPQNYHKMKEMIISKYIRYICKVSMCFAMKTNAVCLNWRTKIKLCTVFKKHNVQQQQQQYKEAIETSYINCSMFKCYWFYLAYHLGVQCAVESLGSSGSSNTHFIAARFA